MSHSENQLGNTYTFPINICCYVDTYAKKDKTFHLFWID